MKEVWKLVEGSTDIEVSNFGAIRKIINGEIRSVGLTATGTKGYLMFSVWDGDKQTKKYLHREVMKCHGEPQPQGKRNVCFLDNNPQNCALENLYWSTQNDRMKRRHDENGYYQGEAHHNALFTKEDILEIRRKHKEGTLRPSVAAVEYGCHPSTISNIVHNRYWKNIQPE